jgi:hypothetical protein
MRTLSSVDLLNAWEQGLGRGPAQRAMILLRLAAGAEDTAGDPARWPIGERDARLLDLRESAFGPQMEGVASCPQCGLQQEFQMPAAALKVDAPARGGELVVASGEYHVEFRLPDSLDVCEIEAEAAVESEVSLRLLERCVTRAIAGERPVTAADLPDDIVREISERMSQADPQAEIDVTLQCTGCSHRWSQPFDIASFLWTELHAWALRTLTEVHQLAAAYGWSETESLSLSPRRRGFYLEMIAG